MGNAAPTSGTYRNNSSQTSTSSADASSQTGSQSYHRQQSEKKKQQQHRGIGSYRKPRMRSFPGSVLLESTLCGAIDHTEDHSRAAGRDQERLWKRVDQFGLCSGASPSFDGGHAADHSTSSSSPPRRKHSLSEYSDDSPKSETPMNATSALFARALVSEVTDNPKTMTPAAMAEREKKLLRAQQAARKKGQGKDGPRPVGAPGGIGQPNLLGSIAQAITGGAADVHPPPTTPSSSVVPPNSLQENRAQQQYPPSSHNQASAAGQTDGSKYSVTIGLSLSRRHSTVGHPDTVTRQTAFDFNELQDRQYKYVSSTDSSGWRAGGGERGGDQSHMASAAEDVDALVDDFGSASLHPHGVPRGTAKNPSPTANNSVSSQMQPHQLHKVAAPDTVHIPIIQIDAESPQAVDAIISALARGEIFIPHMAVLPESLSVNGISPPDLVVRFGCERNDDVPPDEWPNWCLEFMHNQLYEYFHNMGARWMKRPFSITLARKVRWKTVKHMNRYFAHAERVIDAWREKGPQYLDPQLSYIEGGATPEEVARPHGIYLLRNGVPTNYFAPNFDPPYTTKMTRSLLLNVLGKSWDKKRREWTAEPIPRLVTPSMLMAHMCGCADPNSGGFMANEVTHVGTSLGASQISDQRLVTLDQQQDHAAGMTTPAGIVPASNATPRSGSSTPDYSQGSHSRSSGSNRKQQKWQGQHAPHMHVQTEAAASSATAKPPPGEMVPAHHHLKSPIQQQSPLSIHSLSVNQEEKKIDDDGRRQGPAEAPGKYMTFRADGQTIQDPPPATQPRGAVQQQKRPHDAGPRSHSVANSGTTVMHNNLVTSAQRIATNAKASNLASAAAEAKQTIHNSRQANESSFSSSWKKKKGRDRYSSDGGGSPLSSATNRSPRHSPSGHVLPNSDSGVSLEYSLDSASMFMSDVGQEQQQPRSAGVGGGSMMMQFAEATQSSTRATVYSSSAQQRNGRRDVDPQRQKSQPQQPVVADEEETLSLQDSGSSEVIPTDEELFVVGWAKALDPSSGNYYYFTLDRTKTVWENPLSDRDGTSYSTYSSSSSLPSSRRR